MKNVIDKGFILTLIALSAVAILIGMFTGPFGETDISIGASAGACVFSLCIIIFGLSTWKKKRK